MKRLFTIILVLVTMLATMQVQALTWNWSFDDVAGIFTTNTIGMTPYQSGTYTLDSLTVTNAGMTILPLGSTKDGTYNFFVPPNTFEWDSTTQTASNLIDNGDLFGTWEFTFSSGVNRLVFNDNPSTGLLPVAFINSSSTAAPLSIAPVPIPAAAWLFMSGFIGLLWKSRKAREAVN